MATIFGIAVTIVIAGFLWFYVARPILEDFGVIRDGEPVKTYRVPNEALPIVMSRSEGQTRQTDQTDRQTDQMSEADQWLERLEVDRTKTALIELLVYSDWQVGEIRAAVKGDSGAIGKEIEAARQRLGKPPSVSYRTPIAGRPTDPRLWQDDPELQYEAPPN